MKGENLPSWPGASGVYSYLYGALERLGQEAWLSSRRRRKKQDRFYPTEEMSEIIQALNEGDEEKLKWLHMMHKSTMKYL